MARWASLAFLLLLRAQMTKGYLQRGNGQFGILLLLLGLLHFLAEGFQFAGQFLSLGPRQIFFKRIDGTLQLTAGGLDTANLIGTVYQRILQGVQCKLQIVDEVPGVFQFFVYLQKGLKKLPYNLRKGKEFAGRSPVFVRSEALWCE